MSSKTLILCPSARLARSIQTDIAQHQLQAGKIQWQSADVRTVSQWLESVLEEDLLTGQINEATPPYALSAFNEQLLWEEVISQTLKKNAFGELFDVSGLATAAIEANRFMIAWKLHVPREYLAEEARQFIQWQRLFQQRCSDLNALENVRYMDWQLAQLDKSSVPLSGKIAFAGFDQTAPQEKRLREILWRRGVQLEEYQTMATESALAKHIRLQNQEAECRAAVAWAKQYLSDYPKAKLAIIVPRLSEIRNQLADLLDDVFYPLSIRPHLVEMPRHYNFSLGTPLAQQPLVQAALNLLRMLTSFQLQQADVSMLLRSPFWSGSQYEVDAWASLDARMREKMPTQFTLLRFVEFVQHEQQENGLDLSALLTSLNAALVLATSKRIEPSGWSLLFTELLDALNWPGGRKINSLEYQTINAWQKALQQLARLDTLRKTLSASEALYFLQQICSRQVFQAETKLEPSIQILGIMESLSSPVDAIWCMHMNDHIWPPPARPNPLLPAPIQRAAAVPNSDNSVQAAYASTIHQRLMHSAKTIIFSSSQTEGDSQLRPSPLMKAIDEKEEITPLAMTLAEQLSIINNQMHEHIDDHFAPIVKEGEHVSGGTGLLKAQAVCPAWAFYQYRLGAKALKIPVAGLDRMTRGSLVHAVLEHFWRTRHFADLRQMSNETLSAVLAQAVHYAIQDFTSKSNVVSMNALALEHERLFKLVGDWLQFERSKGVSFSIVGCEAERKVNICGIEVTLKIDRIHKLEDGGLIFVDYKTGQVPKIRNWGEDRITEPQLPIYATYYVEDSTQVAGVYFGMVKTAEHDFSGVTEDHFKEEVTKRKPAFIKAFTDWQSLLMHWKSSIESIAQELRSGESAVKFTDESELIYCDVKPLLRLPERKLQFERFQEVSE